MKRKAVAALALCTLLCLSGCGQAVPQKAADGLDWSEDWVTVGNIVGVDTPAGLTARENSDALSAKGMYYAAWSMGEAEAYVNEGGEDAQLYDAQVYLLLAGYSSTDQAEEAVEGWLSMASEQYAVENTTTKTCDGQKFTIITYTYTSETNPYTRGASVFGTYGNYAISVELSCQERFEGDALETLKDFWEHCHYAA